jgi:hypothetical protein
MKDMTAHLEKLRVQMAECEMIRDLATDPVKREMFDNLAAHFKMLAEELEKAMVKVASNESGAQPSGAFADTFLGRRTFEPFPKLDEE